MFDPLILSRIQFAANISFHILFPTITIALAWFLLFFKIKHNMTEHPVWLRAYRFWVKIFALTFALGVVSGITMSFQFGTNWPGFMEKVGNVAGPLLGYEVLTAFFMEATFLGIMLFGMNRVSQRVHTFATFIVAIGTTLSAFWILALNSWMHTPSGFEIKDGVVFPTDWFAIIFNPSFPYRFLHMLIASGLTASFLIAGISSYRMIKGDEKSAPQTTLKVALTVACLLAPLQLFIGDLHGLNTLKHQPQKVAAMEGIWETSQNVPLLLFALPDEVNRTNEYELAIPNLASIILTHEIDGQLQGLNDFKDQHPPVKPVFFGFRIMVGMGMLMILSALVTRMTLFKKEYLPNWQLKLLVCMTFSGWIATLAGWYVTEIGRQPFLVQGVLKVSDAVTDIAPANILTSLGIYIITYAILLVVYIRTVFYTAKKSIQVEEFDLTRLGDKHA
jgi:cytochrome bd ubiquinol oxidase subunit I